MIVFSMFNVFNDTEENSFYEDELELLYPEVDDMFIWIESVLNYLSKECNFNEFHDTMVCEHKDRK